MTVDAGDAAGLPGVVTGRAVPRRPFYVAMASPRLAWTLFFDEAVRTDARRLCRSVVDFVADDAEDDYSVATRWYRAALELLKRLQTRRGAAVDLWAVGCVIGEMYLGRPIFPGKDTARATSTRRRASFDYLITCRRSPRLSSKSIGCEVAAA